MLATHPQERCVQPARVATHDRRSAMGEDGPPNIDLFTPIELTGDWRMAGYGSSLAAHHRSFHRRTIANVDMDAAKCVHRTGNPGDIGHVEEATAVCRYAKPNRRRPYRMLDRKRLEPHSVDHYGLSHWQPAPIINGEATDQIPGDLSRIDRTRRTLGKASSMIRMGVRQHNGRRRNPAEPAQPIRPTINHDARRAPLNKQRAMASVPTRADFDLAARTEERQLECPGV